MSNRALDAQAFPSPVHVCRADPFRGCSTALPLVCLEASQCELFGVVLSVFGVARWRTGSILRFREPKARIQLHVMYIASPVGIAPAYCVWAGQTWPGRTLLCPSLFIPRPSRVAVPSIQLECRSLEHMAVRFHCHDFPQRQRSASLLQSEPYAHNQPAFPFLRFSLASFFALASSAIFRCTFNSISC